MHLDCLNYRLYYVSLAMVLGDGKFMMLFFFVYRHVTSRFIRRSRAETNLDIDAQTPFPQLEKVAYFYCKSIGLSIFSDIFLYKR